MEEDLSVSEDLNMHLNFYQKEDQVLLAVDCIIFGFDKKNLKILLVKRNFEPEMGKWSLIGGFLKKNVIYPLNSSICVILPFKLECEFHCI